MAVSKREILSLYKMLLREGQKFPSYNFRIYALRRVQDAFRENSKENDPQKLKECLKYGNESLDMLKRQVLVAHLYSAPELVIERQGKKD